MIRANITNSDLDDLVGKFFRMNSFSDEAPEVNERYKDAIGVFTSAGPIFRDRNGRHAMINVKWQKPELNGSILSIDAACDDFVVL